MKFGGSPKTGLVIGRDAFHRVRRGFRITAFSDAVERVPTRFMERGRYVEVGFGSA